MPIVRRVLLAAALALAGRTALAAVAVPVAVEELARGASAVVRGRVASSAARWSDDGRRIFTLARVETAAVWRGSAPAQVTVAVPGGVVGDLGQRVAGAPVLGEGEEVVLFLDAAEGGAYRVRGLAQGKFSVQGGVAAPDLRGVAFLPGAPLRAGERRAEPMTVEELERRVREAR